MGTGRGTRAKGAGVIACAVVGALAIAPAAWANTFNPDPGGVPAAIPDGPGGCNGFGSTLEVPFTVSGMNAGAPGDVSVGFVLSPPHTFVGELDVSLVAPDGTTSATIFSRTGATSDASGDSSIAAGPYLFSDQATDQPNGGWWQAARAGGDDATIPSGTYRATAPGGSGGSTPGTFTLISPAFANITNPNGIWKLLFRDHCQGDTGTVNAAALTLAQTYEVTTPSSTGAGSLDAAVSSANANPGLDTITFDPGLPGTVHVPSVETLSDPVDIRGPGADQIAVASAGTSGVFSVSHANAASISGLAITGGNTSGGGGAVANAGVLTLDHVDLHDNTATGAAGGAVYSNATGASLTIRDSIIRNNTAPGGGGIAVTNDSFSVGASATIERTTIRDNSALAGGGGGLYVGPNSAVTVTENTIAGNSAGSGGGVVLGGLNSDLLLENSTVSGNTAPTGANVDFAFGDSLTLRSSIVSNPLGGTNCAGNPVGSAGYNIASNGSCNLTETTDHPSANPQLGPLQDNGGPTPTMAPAPSSPAIDSGAPGSLDVDQRGQPRAVDMPAVANASGGGTDAGAVEVQTGEVPNPTVSVTGGPAAPTTANQPTFDFNAQNAQRVECSIDQGTPSYGACSGASSHTPPGALADGAWTFHVRATTITGAEATDSRTFTVDSVAPSVIVDGGPTATTANRTPSFSFSAGEQSTFACRITPSGQAAPAFAPCSGPGQTHTPSADLANGNYTFEVRATDAAGNAATASRAFAVEVTTNTTAPTVTVDSGPKGPTLDQTPTFSFSANEPVTFACRLGAGDFGPCTGPGQTHSPGTLADGKYTFEVRATDAAGNQATATRAFTLTATACRQALNDVITANGKVAKAEQKLAKAKASGNAKKIKRAKKALKKAKKAAGATKHDVGQLCVTSDG